MSDTEMTDWTDEEEEELEMIFDTGPTEANFPAKMAKMTTKQFVATLEEMDDAELAVALDQMDDEEYATRFAEAGEEDLFDDMEISPTPSLSQYHSLPPSPVLTAKDRVGTWKDKLKKMDPATFNPFWREPKVEDEYLREIRRKWATGQYSYQWYECQLERHAMGLKGEDDDDDSDGDTISETTSSEEEEKEEKGKGEIPFKPRHLRTEEEDRAYMRQLQEQMDRDKRGEDPPRAPYKLPELIADVVAAERAKARAAEWRKARRAARRERQEKRNAERRKAELEAGESEYTDADADADTDGDAEDVHQTEVSEAQGVVHQEDEMSV